MRRREFVALLGSAAVVGGAAVAWPLICQPDQRNLSPPNVYRIGLLSGAAPVADNGPFGAPLIRGLARRGYELGRNLALERRGAEGHIDRLGHLVEELVASKVDVIVTFGYPAAVAAKERSKLPVVAFAVDPVRTGLAESLTRPGGNLTGISDVSAEVTPKRMELLREMAPGLQRVAVLWNAKDLGMTLRYRASQAGAQALGISVQPLGVRGPEDFEEAFATMRREMPDAILMVSDVLTNLNCRRVYEFAAMHRLPAIYEFDFLVRDGGLMSYGLDLDQGLDRVAALVDMILKGANAAELPFEQPTRFRFVLNLKTAKDARPRGAALAARAGRRGDRIDLLFAAMHESGNGMTRPCLVVPAASGCTVGPFSLAQPHASIWLRCVGASFGKAFDAGSIKIGSESLKLV